MLIILENTRYSLLLYFKNTGFLVASVNYSCDVDGWTQLLVIYTSFGKV